ncbi:MAG TPA: hypothetical protein VF022_08275 [Rhodanobacteraceae bacterium]
MSDERDDAIEVPLRRLFEGQVPDEGFSARLMQRLPRRRRRHVAWPVWCGFLAGVAACWLALLRSPLLRVGWRNWVSDDWSAPAITLLLVMLGMVMLALAWGVFEAEDR